MSLPVRLLPELSAIRRSHAACMTVSESNREQILKSSRRVRIFLPVFGRRLRLRRLAERKSGEHGS